MKKVKFENGKTVLKEIQKIASKHGAPVTRWAAAKWLHNTVARARLIKERNAISAELKRLK